MKVDRSLFLVLTGAIASSAVACVVREYQPPAPPPPGSPPPQVATAQPQPGPAPAPTQQAANTPNLHLRPIHEGKSPTPAPTPTPPNPPPPNPNACLDQGGITAPACASTLSCSGNSFPMQRCQAYLQYFDPKVGANAVTCMNSLGSSSCDSQHAYDCGKQALAKACPDGTVTQLCQIAASSCKVSANDCVTMLSGLNTAGQDAVAQCVAGGCSAGLYSCIEGLGASTGAKH